MASDLTGCHCKCFRVKVFAGSVISLLQHNSELFDILVPAYHPGMLLPALVRMHEQKPFYLADDSYFIFPDQAQPASMKIS